MRSAPPARDAAAIWDIATPSRPLRVPGVSMAGFTERGAAPIDLEIVPYPAVTLAIDLGDDLVVADDARREQRGSAVLGVAPGTVHARGRGVACLQIRLSPVVAHAVLGTSPDLGRSAIALEDVWGRDAARVEHRLRDATSWDERFATAEAALLQRLESGRPVDPEVDVVWQLMARRDGQVRVDDLADVVGWSRKRLWSRFRNQVGLTPKRAAQLIRFDRAVHRLAAGERASLVAAETGYADQSHLHRDVLAFAGTTPAAVAHAPWLAVDDVAWRGVTYA
jgi:AraC-like DNA-binding protein